MKIAALDLGSNSSLLLIAEVSKGRVVRVIEDRLRITRLAQGVHESGRIHPEALLRAENCFKDFSKVIKKYKVTKVAAVATSAARDVKNGADFISLGKRYGIPIHIIEGTKEAELTFKGSTYGLADCAEAGVVDVGGGSTEIFAEKGSSIAGTSVNVGCVRLTEMFVSSHPIATEEVEKMKSYVNEKIKPQLKEMPLGLKKIIAVAGTATTLAYIIKALKSWNSEKVEGVEVFTSELNDWIYKLASLSVDKRIKNYYIAPGRADVIVAGAICLHQTLVMLGAETFSVSARGVRYGLAVDPGFYE